MVIALPLSGTGACCLARILQCPKQRKDAYLSPAGSAPSRAGGNIVPADQGPAVAGTTNRLMVRENGTL
jgi:hypothetical protein